VGEWYQHEMTIVLQHQFWDLEVDKNKFSVTLSFHGQPERLVIPFAAVRSFADPSVNFALEFAPSERPEAAPAPTPALVPSPVTSIVPAAIAPPPEAAADKGEEKTGAEVVTLDSFRKR
jgi:uncharacterized protein